MAEAEITVKLIDTEQFKTALELLTEVLSNISSGYNPGLFERIKKFLEDLNVTQASETTATPSKKS